MSPPLSQKVFSDGHETLQSCLLCQQLQNVPSLSQKVFFPMVMKLCSFIYLLWQQLQNTPYLRKIFSDGHETFQFCLLWQTL